MFEAYLAEHGCDVPEHEPDLGVETRPDYLLARDGHTCLCEVKEFAPTNSNSRFGVMVHEDCAQTHSHAGP